MPVLNLIQACPELDSGLSWTWFRMIWHLFWKFNCGLIWKML